MGEVRNSSENGDRRNSHLTIRQVAIVKKLNPRSIIDFGCGTGGFLHQLKSKVNLASTQGVETDIASIKIAKSLGLDVYSTLDECSDSQIVTFWHSLEHLEVNTLERILGKLREKSTSTIVVSVPNASSTQHLLMREKFCFFDKDHHWSQFSPMSLDRLFGEYGFELKKRVVILDYAIFSIIQTAMNRFLPKNQFYELMKRSNGKIEAKVLFSGIIALVKGVPLVLIFTLSEFIPNRRSVLNRIYERVQK